MELVVDKWRPQLGINDLLFQQNPLDLKLSGLISSEKIIKKHFFFQQTVLFHRHSAKNKESTV